MDAKKTEQNYILQDIRQESATVKSYVFYYGLTPFDFLPGQFVVVRMHSAPEFRASLTLSSCPEDRNQFELTLKRTGSFGTHFYDQAEIGSVVSMTAPAGPFSLKKLSDRPIAFLGHDYTIPACRSFLRHLRANQSQRPLVLFQELSAPEEAIYQEEFSQPGYGHFRWVPCHGQEIQADLLRQHLPDFGDWHYYIQAEGPEARRLRSLVQSLEIGADQISVERWS